MLSLTFRGLSEGVCTIKVHFNDITPSLEIETEFEDEREECCKSRCIPDGGGTAVVCIGERQDGTPWNTLNNDPFNCDLVVP